MKQSTIELITAWRDMGPVRWAEGEYGWIGEDGKAIALTPWQRAILGAWFDNRDDCTTLAISNVKKTGKTLTNAVILAWRWLALPGLHFAIGNDLDQSTARQFSEITAMVRRNDYLSQTVKITGKLLTFEPTGSQLAAIAVDAAGNAGANHLTASHTEAWGIIYEAGIRAFEELTTPPGRFYGLPALRICDSYAGFEGESKTWHSLVDRGLEGSRVSDEWPIYQAGGLLLFHTDGEEARDRCFRGTPKEAESYYADQQRSLRPNAFIRMHGNKRTSNESTFLPEGVWEACYSPEVGALEKGRLVLGIDASTSRDCSALVGTFFNTSTKTVDVALVRVWKPIKGWLRGGKATIDLDETIGAEVLRLHSLGIIDSIVADPFQLHSLLVQWERLGIRVIELPQNSGRVLSDTGLYDAIVSRRLRHFNDPVLNEHVKNAVAQETERGIRLTKDKATMKIDACVALSMSHWGSNRGVVYAPMLDLPELISPSRWAIDDVSSLPWAEQQTRGTLRPGWTRKY